MLGAVGYPTKKALRESVGKPLRFVETSMYSNEYKSNGKVTMCGPDTFRKRTWYATVTLENDIIVKVQ